MFGVLFFLNEKGEESSICGNLLSKKYETDYSLI